MKTIQLILRIIVSPIVFLFSFALMTVFPGPIALFLGLGGLLMYLFGMEDDKFIKEEWKDYVIMTTIWFWYPFYNTYLFIVKAEFLT